MSAYLDPNKDNSVLGQALPIDARRGFINTTGPSHASMQYQSMFKRWEPILYLNSGTIGMREAKTKYLPKFTAETDPDYEQRLAQTILFEIYPKTIESVCSLPFASKVVFNNIPSELEYLKDDCDGEGTPIEDFAFEILKESFDLGLSHILVEYPASGGFESLAEEREAGLKPYFCQISPTALIGWTYERVGFKNVLTSIRVKETFFETNPNNEYEQIAVEQIREIRPGKVIEWRYDEKAKINVIYKETLTSTKEIQLVTLYAKKKGFLMGAPVAESLAHLNIKHYQKVSDLDVIEHYACVPLLFGKGPGFSEDADVKIGKGMITSEDPTADLKYVEIAGQGVAHAQRSVEALEKRAVSMGADLLAERGTSTRETATSKKLDNSKSISVLSATVGKLERVLKECVEHAAGWIGKTLPEDFAVNLGDKMELSFDANEISNLILLWDKGAIDIEGLIYELKRRDKLAPTTEAFLRDEEKKKQIIAESMPKQASEGSTKNVEK